MQYAGKRNVSTMYNKLLENTYTYSILINYFIVCIMAYNRYRVCIYYKIILKIEQRK